LVEHISKVEQFNAAKQERFKSLVHDTSVKQLQQREEIMARMKNEKDKKEFERLSFEQERKKYVLFMIYCVGA
jgi:hypothetical protein